MTIVHPAHRRPASRRGRVLTLPAIAAVAALLASACGGDDSGDSATTEAPAATSDGATTAAPADTSDAPAETTDISLQLSWLADTEFAPLFLADANGHFAENGVEAELIPGGPDIGAIEAIVGSGAADVGIATDIFSVISATADGSPFVVLGTLYQENLHGFISNPDSPITSPADLAGKRLGGSQGVQPKFEAILSAAGADPTDYTFVPSGFGPDLVINGDVDAQSVFITDEVLAYREATGEEPVLMKWNDIGLPSYTLVLFTTQEYLDANRDALMGMLAAIQAGQADNAADPVAGATLAAEEYGKDAGLTVDGEIAKNAEYLKYAESADTEANGYLWIDPAFLEGEVYAGMEAAGLKTAPVEDVIDMSLLEEIKAAG